MYFMHCSPVQTRVPPFAMVSQLYTIVMDRTKADRELEELRTGNKVRVLRTLGGAERAVCFTTDFLAAAESAAQADGSGAHGASVIAALQDTILPAFTGTAVTRAALLAALEERGAGSGLRSIDGLLGWGVLAAHTLAQEPSLAFGLPGGGLALRAVTEGRKVRLLAGPGRRGMWDEFCAHALLTLFWIQRSINGAISLKGTLHPRENRRSSWRCCSGGGTARRWRRRFSGGAGSAVARWARCGTSATRSGGAWSRDGCPRSARCCGSPTDREQRGDARVVAPAALPCSGKLSDQDATAPHSTCGAQLNQSRPFMRRKVSGNGAWMLTRATRFLARDRRGRSVLWRRALPGPEQRGLLPQRLLNSPVHERQVDLARVASCWIRRGCGVSSRICGGGLGRRRAGRRIGAGTARACILRRLRRTTTLCAARIFRVRQLFASFLLRCAALWPAQKARDGAGRLRDLSKV